MTSIVVSMIALRKFMSIFQRGVRGSRRSQRQIDREMKEEAERIQRENQAREAEEMSNSPRLELFPFYINGQTSHKWTLNVPRHRKKA